MMRRKTDETTKSMLSAFAESHWPEFTTKQSTNTCMGKAGKMHDIPQKLPLLLRQLEQFKHAMAALGMNPSRPALWTDNREGPCDSKVECVP